LYTEFPTAWELQRALGKNESEAQGDEDEDEDESDVEDNAGKLPPDGVSIMSPSQAYREFLGFLESGCAASPLQGYPAVVVIVSTIPSSVSLLFL
jgi:E3 ubiquitin-protein ligase listerin